METCWKNAKSWSPDSVCGKYVTAVLRGHEIMEVRKIPMRREPLMRYIMRRIVKNLYHQEREHATRG